MDSNDLVYCWVQPNLKPGGAVRWPLHLTIVLAVAVSACGGDEAQPPLARFEGSAWSSVIMPDRLDQLIIAARESSISACMSSKGWKYDAELGQRSMLMFEELRMTDREFRELYGYGISTNVPEPELIVGPNERRVESMTSAERNEYYTDLSGGSSGSESSCQERADEELSVFFDARETLVVAYQRDVTDQALTSLEGQAMLSRWRKCIGWSGAASATSASDVAVLLRKAFETNQVPEAEQARLEVDVATRELDCSRSIDADLIALRLDYEEPFVQAHQADVALVLEDLERYRVTLASMRW